MRRQALHYFGRVLISLGLLALLFGLRAARWQQVLEAVAGAAWWLWGAGVVLFALAQTVSAWRWQLLLGAEGYALPMRRLVALYFVGMFFNLFLPTAIGGDAVRAYLLRGATRRTDVSVASIFLERLCGFAVLMTIAALALLLCYPRLRGSPVAAVVLVVIGLFVVGVILLINRRVARLAAGLADRLPGQRLWRAAGRIHEAILRYRGHGGALAQVVALSFLVQAMSIGTYWLMAASMGLRPPVALWAALVPVVIVASMVPISLGGLGVREGAAVYVFPLAAMTADQAVAVSLLFFSVTVACSLAGAALLPLQRSATALARQVGG